MDTTTEWQSLVGFSDRLNTVIKIKSARVAVDPAISAADALSEARNLETEIFNSSNSKEKYENSCQTAIQSAEDGISRKLEEEEDPVFPDESVGRQFGKYHKATHHRDGLFSAVFKAKAPESTAEPPDGTAKSTAVALKITHPSSEGPPHDSKREVRLLKSAASANVIPLLDDFFEAGDLILVFPFIPFELNHLLEKKSLSKSQQKRVLRDLFSAIAHTHSLGIIHRDIKPLNILLHSPDGPAYLADFGIAWKENDPTSEPVNDKITDVGTTCYRPPELLFGNKAYSSSLDMWSAGCVAAQVISLHGETLFDAGELGSELALIQSIFVNLGTPSLEKWPEAAGFPDWGKMQFFEYEPKDWAVLVPGASTAEKALIQGLVRYESGLRLSAQEVLKQDYFSAELDEK